MISYISSPIDNAALEQGLLAEHPAKPLDQRLGGTEDKQQPAAGIQNPCSTRSADNPVTTVVLSVSPSTTSPGS